MSKAVDLFFSLPASYARACADRVQAESGCATERLSGEGRALANFCVLLPAAAADVLSSKTLRATSENDVLVGCWWAAVALPCPLTGLDSHCLRV